MFSVPIIHEGWREVFGAFHVPVSPTGELKRHTYKNIKNGKICIYP